MSHGRLISHFESFLLNEKWVTNNTFTAYKKDIEQLVEFLKNEKKTIKTCNANHIKKFLRILKNNGMKAKTLSRKISSIKLLYSFLSERFKIRNKAVGIIFPKLEKFLPNFLTEKEILKLLQAADSDNSEKGIRNKVMIYLLYASGMRVSELVNIKVDQIQFDDGFIKLEGKGNKERMIPLPKNILDLIKFYIDNSRKKLITKAKCEMAAKENYLFLVLYNGMLKQLTRQSLWNILKRILTSAGINKNISPHSLRHSLATHLLKGGADIRSLQMLLGHEQISTIEVYTHLENSHVRKIYDKKHPRA